MSVVVHLVSPTHPSPSPQRRVPAEVELDLDAGGWRFRLALNGFVSAPSTAVYPTEEAAWAAASRHGLRTPHDRLA